MRRDNYSTTNNMNQVQNNDKDRVMKTLAIVGFIAVVAFGVWLAVQIVSLVPNAFTSLASIADSVYNYDPTTEEVVDEEDDNRGIFGFGNNNEDEDSNDVIVLTEDDFPEDNYFIGNGEKMTTDSEDDEMDYYDEDDENGYEEPTVVTETSSEPTPYLPQEPQFIETVTYSVPTSNPNGYVDLATKIVAVGHITSSGNFVQGARMDNDTRGAFQFEVKNIGTKTSDEWDFVAKLTAGQTFKSPTQLALKPQERVVFTLGYDNVGEDGISVIAVNVQSDDDTNSENDSFTWAVSVVE